MRINIARLSEFGFKVEMSEDGKNVDIYSNQDNPRARKHLKAASVSMGYTCAEEDQLLDAANRISTIRAIKIASD